MNKMEGKMGKTYGDMMKEALAIKTQKEADIWFKKEVKIMHKANPDWSLKKCADVVRSNLGYIAGYYDQSVSEHVHKFFGANHPIFGSPSYWDTMTPKKAFDKGREMAKKWKIGK